MKTAGLVVAVLGLAVFSAPGAAPAAAGHARGCVVPREHPPVGDTGRVHAIPHGCVRLAVPRDETRLPTPLRASQLHLDRAHGGVGICGHDSTYLFFVSYRHCV